MWSGTRPRLYGSKTGDRYSLCEFVISDEKGSAIKTALASAPSVERVYRIELVDAGNVVHAVIDKTVYVRRMGEKAEIATI